MSLIDVCIRIETRLGNQGKKNLRFFWFSRRWCVMIVHESSAIRNYVRKKGEKKEKLFQKLKNIITLCSCRGILRPLWTNDLCGATTSTGRRPLWTYDLYGPTTSTDLRPLWTNGLYGPTTSTDYIIISNKNNIIMQKNNMYYWFKYSADFVKLYYRPE